MTTMSARDTNELAAVSFVLRLVRVAAPRPALLVDGGRRRGAMDYVDDARASPKVQLIMNACSASKAADVVLAVGAKPCMGCTTAEEAATHRIALRRDGVEFRHAHDVRRSRTPCSARRTSWSIPWGVGWRREGGR